MRRAAFHIKFWMITVEYQVSQWRIAAAICLMSSRTKHSCIETSIRMAPVEYHRTCCVAAAVIVAIAAPRFVRAAATITYVGVIRDQTDFARLNIGKAGYWFPQFASKSPVEGRPTEENACDALPPWAGPLNHVTSFLDPAYLTRTFSQDGPGKSKGGQPKWNEFTLPDGKVGNSGAIVDPHACKNANNTINRIQLGKGTPATFFFHIATDNTNREHDPATRLVVRGNSYGIDLESDTSPTAEELKFNGVADIYTYRFDGFGAEDFIKVRLKGDSAHKAGPGIGGILFDEKFEPNRSPPIERRESK